MANTPSLSPAEEFRKQATALSCELGAALVGRALPTFVVLEALMQLHRCLTSRLPADVKTDIALDLGQYASCLMLAAEHEARTGAPSLH